MKTNKIKKVLAGVMALSVVASMVSMAPMTAAADEVIIEQEIEEVIEEEVPEEEPVVEEVIEEEVPEEEPVVEEVIEEEEPIVEEEPVVEEEVKLYEFDAETGTILKYLGEEKDVVIPSEIDGVTVEHIGKDAFNHTKVTSVVIPDTVTSIDEMGFYMCQALEYVTIPNSVTSIGMFAFLGCHSLENVTILGNPGMARSVTSSNIDSITIPCTSKDYESKLKKSFRATTVNYIHAEEATDNGDGTHTVACAACGEVLGTAEHVYEDGVCACGAIDEPEEVKLYKFDAETGTILRYLGHEKDVVIPSKIGGVTVKHIGSAFRGSGMSGSDGIKSVVIPDTVVSIGNSTFADCEQLESVTIPNSVTSIGDYAFQSCFSLTSVNIPDSVTSIGKLAFAECASLENLTIPDSVTSIGAKPFISVGEELDEPANITISCKWMDQVFQGYRGNVTYIHAEETTCTDNGDGTHNVACAGCGETIKTTGHSYGYFGDVCLDCGFEAPIYEFDAETGTILKFLYYRVGTSANVVVPSEIDGVTVKHIGDWAFSSTYVGRVVIPDTVTSIGNHAFDFNWGLGEVIIPASVTKIGTSAFEECDALRNVTILGCPEVADNLGYAFTDSLTVSCAAKDYAPTWQEKLHANTVNYVHAEETTCINNGDGTHSVACAGCGEVSETAEHVYEDGVCACGVLEILEPTVTVELKDNKLFRKGETVSNDDFVVTATYDGAEVAGTVVWSVLEDGLAEGENTLEWTFIPEDEKYAQVSGTISVNAEAVQEAEKTNSRVFAPAGGVVAGQVYDLSDYDFKHISGVEITFKDIASSNCVGAVHMGNWCVVTQDLNNETVVNNTISIAVDQYALIGAPDTFAIYDWNSYCPLGEIESVVFYYMEDPTIEIADDAVVIENTNNNVFDLSAYDYAGVTSVTLLFAEDVYSGCGALVSGQYGQNQFNFEMKRSNADYITVDVADLTDTLVVNNYYNLAKLNAIVLGGVTVQENKPADETPSQPEEEILLGDVNGDGVIDDADSLMICNEITSISNGNEPSFTEKQKKAADINGDGAVTWVDSEYIYTYWIVLKSSGDDVLSWISWDWVIDVAHGFYFQ